MSGTKIEKICYIRGSKIAIYRQMRTREQRMTTVTIGCAVANLLLAVAKIIAGLVGKSAAMTADAIHSMSDAVCDAVVLVIVRISAKGKDDRHNWGRGKYETITTFAISVLLIIIGVELMSDGISSIRNILSGGEVEKPGMIALWVAIISILVQECIFQWTVHVGKAVDSQTMIANAWHHRSDALSSVGSLIGIGGAIFLGGKWIVLDPLVGCIISVVILAVAVKMLIPALNELTDGALPQEEIEKATEIIRLSSGDGLLKSLKTRKNGNSDIFEITVCVEPHTTIAEAEEMTGKIEEALRQEFGSETQVSVMVRHRK